MKTFSFSSFATVFFALLFTSCAESNQISSEITASDVEASKYVNPFIGTGGHGHTYPGATSPFGLVQLSPDTRLTGWDGCGGYHFTDSLIYGFSHTHLQGTGISDYGDILFMPTNNTTHEGTNWGERYRSLFQKDSEISEAGYYSVFLDDHKVKVELTTTPRVGIHKYTYAPEDSCVLFIDMGHRDELIHYSFDVVNDSTIIGHRVSKEWAQEQHIYFAAVFSKPFEYLDQTYEVEYKTNPETGQEYQEMSYVPVFPLKFGQTSTLISKVALSSTSTDGALKNLAAEAEHWDFDLYRSANESRWSQQLNKISVKGGSKSELTNFYTALYHSSTVPNIFCDVDGKYRGTDLKIHESTEHKHYSVFSLWDTYRATHPLYTIIENERTKDFVKTFVKDYEQGGALPMWELAGNYTECMIGYHSASVLADASIKGISQYKPYVALEGMKHASTEDKHGKQAYMRRGFLSSEDEGESVSKTLEYAYDDWCIASFAKSIGETKTYNEYLQRAQYYKNQFNPKTGFFQAKRNGNFVEPFDPAEVNFNFTEANAWQYNFFVPHDVSGHIELLGGDQAYCEMLDGLFSAPSDLTGRGQPDITGLIGQYAHGNEPSHHMAYLYTYAGQPWKTQELIHQILTELYTDQPDGLSGNEDCGQMSSWYVLSSLGLYSVAPGSDQYVLTSPLFDEATINLESSETFAITTNKESDNSIYIHGIELNGEPYENLFLWHADIMSGGTLHFILKDQPSKKFGVKTESRPSSSIEEQLICPTPIVNVPRTFKDSVLVSFSNVLEGVKYKYTISSISDEQSAVQFATHTPEYSGPFYMDNDFKLEVTAFKEGYIESKTVTSIVKQVPHNWKIELLGDYNNQYTGGGDNALVDGIEGSANFKTGEWQGYWGDDMECIIDLGEVRNITNMSVGCLQDSKPWILYPESVTFLVSDDTSNFKKVATIKNEVPANDFTPQRQNLSTSKDVSGRYVKVSVKNHGPLPSWHLSAGNDAWLFVDEVIIDVK